MRILLAFLLFPFLTVGQNTLLLSAKVNTGIGWWSYKKGMLVADTMGLAGYGRSHASMMSSYTLDVSYATKKLAIGFGGTYRQLWDNRMIYSTHTSSSRNIDTTAKKAVNFIQFGLLADYFVYRANKFEFGPHLEIGTSNMISIYPKNAAFRFQGYWSFGLLHRWWFSKQWGVTFLPSYSQTIALPQAETAPGERHDIYGVSMGLGLNYRFQLHQTKAAE